MGEVLIDHRQLGPGASVVIVLFALGGAGAWVYIEPFSLDLVGKLALLLGFAFLVIVAANARSRVIFDPGQGVLRVLTARWPLPGKEETFPIPGIRDVLVEAPLLGIVPLRKRGTQRCTMYLLLANGQKAPIVLYGARAPAWKDQGRLRARLGISTMPAPRV